MDRQVRTRAEGHAKGGEGRCLCTLSLSLGEFVCVPFSFSVSASVFVCACVYECTYVCLTYTLPPVHPRLAAVCTCRLFNHNTTQHNTTHSHTYVSQQHQHNLSTTSDPLDTPWSTHMFYHHMLYTHVTPSHVSAMIAFVFVCPILYKRCVLF
jgi:hypothetical protein